MRMTLGEFLRSWFNGDDNDLVYFTTDKDEKGGCMVRKHEAREKGCHYDNYDVLGISCTEHGNIVVWVA